MDSIRQGIERAKEMLHPEEKRPVVPAGGEPFLLVGLGNPGREYRNTRHNIGFMVIDEIGKALNIKLARVQNKAIVGSGQFEGSRIVLAKPQTYMNLSGEAIVPLVRFYKVPPAHLMLIHDDLDLPFGTIRLRPGGGSGGQKGVASTISRLGTQDFPRMRVGIGRPPGQMDPAAYVLYPFRAAEQETLRYLLDHAVQAVKTFMQNGLDQAMNQFNGTVGD